MAPSPKKKPTNNKPAPKADMVAPERLIVMRPLVFNRPANAAPDPRLAEQRALAQASTQALADAFAGCSDDDSSGIDMAAIEKALKGGANINAPVNALGQTALHVAVNENNLALAAQLLRAGANTRARDHAGLTPLISALREGDDAMSGMLARAEERPEAQVLEGRHAIHDAAKHGHVQALEALIVRGLSPTIRDIDEDSPLMEALRAEKCDAVFALAYGGGLQQGMLKKYNAVFDGSGGLDMPDYNMSAFLKAALDAKPVTLKPLPVALPQKRGVREEELFARIASREEEQIAALLKRRPDLNARDDAGDTPLIAALRRGVMRTADLLVAKSDVKATGLYGQTALHLAAANTDFTGQRMLRKLVELGADINAQDARGQTALMKAALAGADDNVRLLLAHKAKLELTDKLGLSVTDHAGFAQNAEVTELLEEAAARKKPAAAKTKTAQTAFKAAAAKQVKSTAKAPAKKTTAKKPLAKQAGSRYRY